MKLICIIFLFNILLIDSYIVPQTFREWIVIGIENKINKNVPYHYNIGVLPMVLWYNKTNPQSIINSCHKHIGNTLRESYINNDELICPFHKSKYTIDDNIGTIKKSNGLLWWSYKSFQSNPSTIKKDNNNYNFEVNNDFISTILNFIVDFKGDENTYKFYKKKLLIKKERDFLIYRYPYTLIFKNKYMLNINPIDINKSQIFLTTSNNNELTNKDINKFKNYVEKRYNNFKYKFLLLNDNNSYINKVYNCYKDYMFPDDYTIKQFMINKRFY